MSYRKVFISTFVVVGALALLAAGIWFALAQGVRHQEVTYEQEQESAQQEAYSLQSCDTLQAALGDALRSQGTAPVGMPTDDDNWDYKHEIQGVWNDGRGDIYDGLTPEDYAACMAKFIPEIRKAGGTVPNCSDSDYYQGPNWGNGNKLTCEPR